ncbi:MAG: NCS2 family permease [Oscillospiraceae bacterium]|jgi:AGZA family xanthine/uracil permease-like MFS transporter|nr:NCS2 family permease [Oscillospiraceae bacterium]
MKLLASHFKLKENRTTFSNEIICGITTFLTMLYAPLFTPAIVAETGMPYSGVFAATVLTAGVGTILIAVISNLPIVIAPIMAFNTFMAQTICLDMGFHWREALAMSYMSGFLMICLLWPANLRRRFYLTIPDSLKYATCIGAGLFISLVGFKRANFVSYTSPPGTFTTDSGGALFSDSSSVPTFLGSATPEHIVAIVGFIAIIALMALEVRTRQRYGAFFLGIIVAAFVGIPLNVTQISSLKFDSFISGLNEVSFSFYGRPGVLSLFDAPGKVALSIVLVIIITFISIAMLFCTIGGIGSRFEGTFTAQKMDKSIKAASSVTLLSAFLGTSPPTVSVVSVAGISSGGKTGLAALVTGALFILCLPFAGVFSSFPHAAVAPALIVSGVLTVPLIKRVNWSDFEEGFPGIITIIAILFTYSIVYGIAIGYAAHLLIKTSLGKWREVRFLVHVIVIAFVALIALRSVLKI